MKFNICREKTSYSYFLLLSKIKRSLKKINSFQISNFEIHFSVDIFNIIICFLLLNYTSILIIIIIYLT